MNPKMGFKGKGAGESGSRWSTPNPQSSDMKPDSSPAKPKGGPSAGGMANKHANTSGGSKDLYNKLKNRY